MSANYGRRETPYSDLSEEERADKTAAQRFVEAECMSSCVLEREVAYGERCRMRISRVFSLLCIMKCDFIIQ